MGYTVCDIETDESGAVLDIGLLWDEGYATFSKWGDFIDFIWSESLRRGAKGKKIHTEFREIFAHNGANFDWLSLAEWLKKNPEYRHRLKVLVAGSQGIGFDLVLPHKRGTVRLRDSLRLLPASLKNLCHDFGIEQGKIDLDGKLPAEIKRENPTLYYEYLRRDCESLRSVLNEFHAVLNKAAPIERLSMTIASQAIKVLDHYNPYKFFRTNNEETKAWLRRGYTGGRVEVFQPGYFENVIGVDINSLYPFVMANNEYPLTEQGVWVDEYRGKHGLYEIEFMQPAGIPLLRDEESHEFKLNGRGVYTKPELDKLLQLGGSMNVIQGYEIIHIGRPFKRFVKKLYRIRNDARKKGNTAVQYTMKILLNSSYGKFGQRSERQHILLADEAGEIKDGTVEAYGDVFVVHERRDSEKSCLPIACYVTAYARLELYKYLETLGDSVIYSDTDSAYFIPPGELPLSWYGTKLGQVKVEFQGEGVFLGKKLYGLRGEYEKLRIKGVRLGGNLGATYTFHELLAEWQAHKEGMEIAFDYFSFPTVREVLLKDLPACKIQSRRRKIKPTL